MKFKIYAWVNERANCHTTTWEKNNEYMKLVQETKIKGCYFDTIEHFITFQETLSEKGYFILDNEYFTAIL